MFATSSSSVVRSLLCGVFAVSLCATIGPARAESEPPQPRADAAKDTVDTDDGARDVVWRERFVTRVPDGWLAVTDEFAANTQATPEGVPARATLMTSPAGTHVMAVFVDGRAISLALGSQTLFQLTESYLEGFLLTRGRPLARTEPWSCQLDVPGLTPVFGGRAYTRSLGVPDIDRPDRDDGQPPVWTCAAREVKTGAFVLVLGWVDADAPERTPDEVLAEIVAVMAHTGMRP